MGLEEGFELRGVAELEEEEELWLACTNGWLAEALASWRKILSLLRRVQASSSLKPPTAEPSSKLNLRGDRGEGRGLGWGLLLAASASSRLGALAWSMQQFAGGSRGSSGAERLPCSRDGNFLSRRSEPESDHSHSNNPGGNDHGVNTHTVQKDSFHKWRR